MACATGYEDLRGIKTDRADALILGGTELSLILPGDAYHGVPVLNAAALHVAAALDWLTGGDPPAAA